MGIFTRRKAADGTVLWFVRGEDTPQVGAAQLTEVPVVISVMETLASACDSVRLSVRTGESVTSDHPLIRLLRRPNPLANMGLLYYMSLLWDAHGEVLVVIDATDTRRLVLWPVEPGHVVSWPRQSGDSWVIRFAGGDRTVRREDVIRVTRPFAGSLYHGKGWLVEALRDEMEMLEAMTRYLRNWFTNNGIPPLIVAAPGIDEAQIDRYEARWLEKVRGFARRLTPFFMRGKPDVIKLENAPPTEIPAFYRSFRDAIYQAFGIPPEVMGSVENSNRATAEAAHLLFMRYRVRPRVMVFISALQEQLAPRFGHGVELVADISEPGDREVEAELLTKNPWIATLNEHRAAAGLPPVEGGDVFLAPQPVVEAH